MSELQEVIKDTLSLGGYVLVAYIQDMENLMAALGQIPYVQLDPPHVAAREGTAARAVRIVRDDQTECYALVTGGAISRQEAQTVMAVLERHGSNQVYAGPGLGPPPGPDSAPQTRSRSEDGDRKRKPWWCLW